MLISCSIVCYLNKPIQITRVLNSVITSAIKDSIEIVVYLVDNSPNDDLAAVALSTGAKYIHLPWNPGFGSAHNVAISKASEIGSAYHLVLNPDTYFDKGVIPKLLEFMETCQDVGQVMPNIRYPDGANQYLCKLLPSPCDLLMRRFASGLYRSSGRLDRYELRDTNYNKIMDVPALSGCFMLLRMSVLQKVGAFDERFFMYLEDVDLSRRIGEVARTVYFPYVSITHEYVKGSYKNWRLLFHHIRSAILYFNKWGWVFDWARKKINRDTLQKLKLL